LYPYGLKNHKYAETPFGMQFKGIVSMGTGPEAFLS